MILKDTDKQNIILILNKIKLFKIFGVVILQNLKERERGEKHLFLIESRERNDKIFFFIIWVNILSVKVNMDQTHKQTKQKNKR